MEAVSLELIADFIALTGDGWVAYLNRETGEIISVSDEMRDYASDGVDPEYLPVWKRNLLPAVSRALSSAACIPLPDRYRVHEADIMEQFAYRQADLALRSALLEAARGASPVRGFRTLIYERRIEDSWLDFQRVAVEKIARNWLELHGIPYR